MIFTTQWAGQRLVEMERAESTNLTAKASDLPHGTLFLAREQTAGRGRNGRVWQSMPGQGIYMTLLLRPEALLARDAARLTPLAAVSVCQGLRAIGVDARIKWPNDIVAGGRKLVGMLCETTLRGDFVDKCAMGIGINYVQGPEDFDPAFRETATSITMLLGEAPSRQAAIQPILAALEERYQAGMEGRLTEEYATLSATIGQRVRVLTGDAEWTGLAAGIRPDGALLVQDTEGEIRPVMAGDVSVRGLMGYV